MVQHSGLEAELLAGQTGQEKVPIPTRAANLWFARQFILAEAGGPLLSEPAPWAKFVKRLAPGRLHSVFGKGTPGATRAALVCVDCETFMKPGAAEAIAASVDRIRTRLREVSQYPGDQPAGLRTFHARRPPSVLPGLRPQSEQRGSNSGAGRDISHGLFRR